MIKTTFLFLVLYFALFKVSFAQTELGSILKSDANKSGVFYTLEDARKSPDKVIELHLLTRNISEIPIEITKYKNLKALELSDNNIGNVPQWFNELKKLEVLSMSKNAITKFPSILFELPKLKKIDLTNNQISDFEKYSGDSSVEDINLSLNKINSLPEYLGNLTNLKILKLENNLFETIPIVVFKIKNLEYVYFYHNRIVDFESVPQIENHIKGIYLNNNPIEETKIIALKRLMPQCDISMK